MNVSLTPERERFVSTKVDSGRYNSASEVVREALRLLEEHDQARARQLTEFNRELGGAVGFTGPRREGRCGRVSRQAPAKITRTPEMIPTTGYVLSVAADLDLDEIWE
jgi:putative addiction module CopG family antidote